MKNYIDCHSHSHNSPDASSSVVAMCEKAMELGLAAYAVTDHCEAHRFFPKEKYDVTGSVSPCDIYDYGKLFENSMAEIAQAKEIYEDRLNLICGIELGQATHDFNAADIVVSDKRLDFVIGSMHQLPNYEDFAFLDYKYYEINILMEKYFQEIYQMCIWGKFDVLGHLTYTLRYMQGEQGYTVDLKPFDDIICEIFKLLSYNGKGIEINTSGLRQKIGATFPDLYYVKMFKDCGGEIISIGSDSHCPDDIGKGIAEGTYIAKQAGFEYLTYFKNRKPEFIKI